MVGVALWYVLGRGGLAEAAEWVILGAMVLVFFVFPSSWTANIKFSTLDVSTPNAVMLDPTLVSIALVAVAGLFAYKAGLLRKMGISS